MKGVHAKTLLAMVTLLALIPLTAACSISDFKEEGQAVHDAARSVKVSYNIILWVSIGLAGLTALIAVVLILLKIAGYMDY